ncbi:uncharacterized protein C9orf152-like [Polypterus senegalus]|uniref:uncharacterized protein C9orf152-like n=1 Tax=Polypterus senegalus TaxID=55291 RepID=UPI00196636EA|nr:uncharacterized protein C9orf152-like [Polypterus senegalus]
MRTNPLNTDETLTLSICRYCCCVALTCPWQSTPKGEARLLTSTNNRDWSSRLQTGRRKERESDMDVPALRAQYLGATESQRRRTHIVLRQTANSQQLKDSYIVSMVPVNHEVRKPKAFEDQIPVKEIQLDPQDYKTSWHTHLGIYRKAQAKSQKLYDVSNLSNVERDTVNQESSAHKDLSSVREISMSDKQQLDETTDNTGERKSDGHDSPKNFPASDFVTFVPRKFSASGSLSRQLSIVSYKPPASSSKLCYYPFPQRKCPKKSEAARRLGLYATY